MLDVEGLIKRLTDEGRIIEAGWIGLRYSVLPMDCSEVQLREMKKAFFSGAAHLLASIGSFMDDGTEPTENDLRRMEMVEVELMGFQDSLKREAKGMRE